MVWVKLATSNALSATLKDWEVQRVAWADACGVVYGSWSQSTLVGNQHCSARNLWMQMLKRKNDPAHVHGLRSFTLGAWRTPGRKWCSSGMRVVKVWIRCPLPGGVCQPARAALSRRDLWTA
jgi:hypothetical protein